MTENMSNDSPTTKKRKANDGRATVSDSISHSGGGGGGLTSRLGRGEGTSPTAQTTCGGENLTQKLDAMMQMMSRMEESQLATVRAVGSLERRCENLEAKCSVLEHMLEMKTNSIKEHVDSKFDKQNKYNKMLVRNQSWEYSTPVYSEEHWINDGYNEDEAFYLAENSDYLKDSTENLRRGEFPADYSDDRKGINLDWDGPILENNTIRQMGPHWEEFAEALKQFTPAFGVLPYGCETFFTLENIQLDRQVAGLLKDALMNKPFQKLSFVNRDDAGDDEGIMSVHAILDIVESNEHLRKLTVGNNRIQLEHIAKICSAVHEHSFVELDLFNCFENGLGDAMVTSLLASGGLVKLETLGLESNGITSSSITLLANFLATNPPLQKLDLRDNIFNDNDAEVLSNALRSNTTLRSLYLHGNTIGDAGEEALRLVVHGDGNNLNSIADSNHSCNVVLYRFDCWNVDGKPERFNRARKIYTLLSKRNKSMLASNVQHFDEIDVNLLPFMLKAVQRYASDVYPHDRFSLYGYCRVEPLSIVYEVMRKWDKVFPLYNLCERIE